VIIDRLFHSLILVVVSLLAATAVHSTAAHSAEHSSSCPLHVGPTPMLGLMEHTASTLEPGASSLCFVLYSDRTVIYRDRKSDHTKFMTGTVDDETWQTFEKIVAELPAVKTSFFFSEANGQEGGFILFNAGKQMRQLPIGGPVLVKKVGSGKDARYSTSLPPIQIQGSLDTGGEVPQSALGAWFESHNFVPKDAHPWLPDHFDVSLYDGKGSKTVTWPASWPQLSDAKPMSFGGGYSLQMPGRYLREFEQLFSKRYMAARMSGKILVVGYSVFLPSQGELQSAIPVGVKEDTAQTLPPLPADFLQNTPVSEIKKIVRERNYNADRMGTDNLLKDGIGVVSVSDVIEELCQSSEPEKFEAGLELSVEAKRDPLHIASMLASTHFGSLTRAIIVRHLDDSKFSKVTIPLIQEAVARGEDLETVEPISLFWAKLKAKKEPIAWLPLHRADMETALSFPQYLAGGSASSIPIISAPDHVEKPPVRTKPEVPFTALPVSMNEEAAARCVHSWEKSEAKLFEINSGISPADVTAKQLLKMRLACLAGATPGDVKVEAVTSDTAFGLMYGVASGGGAYGRGECGGYGRLSAWQSMAALTGLSADSPFDEVYKAAKESSWWTFSSKSKWFNNIAWDLGIVCLRPDKRHLVVLAASDED